MQRGARVHDEYIKAAVLWGEGLSTRAHLQADAIIAEDHVACPVPLPRPAVLFKKEQVDDFPAALLALAGHHAVFHDTACTLPDC